MKHRTALTLFVLAALAACAPTQPATSAQRASFARASLLHNLHTITPGLISGSGPQSPAALDELRAMGVRTIISVDGAAPDADGAQARGMRYVHIPTTYATITDGQRLEIARAVRDLPGPIYLHCHHGKHRGPAVAAAAAVTLGRLTNDEAVTLMKRAGTSPSYSGLYRCVQETRPASIAALDAAPADFPSVRRPAGLVAAMVEIDAAFENLGLIRKNNWRTPAEHPDLVPAAEAGRLADHLRTSVETAEATAFGADFIHLMRESSTRASELERGFVAGARAEALDAAWGAVEASCKACHTAYRDR
ncbi:MAG: cytochrome c [Phycisphaerales bacterium]